MGRYRHPRRITVGTTSDKWWGADDSERPLKHAPQAIKTFSEEELLNKRDELFTQGSDFKPAKREDIIGIDNVLDEINQVIHWLHNAQEYQKYDSRLEPGIIFEGDPGTGKTLVSRYIASESGALFINIRDFPHQGPLYKDSDIADLFRRARESYAQTKRPVVLFWDEFEGAAVERSNATPEQASTVSQITAELDGIHGKNEGILLIGCTNYIFGIDAALRRAGRMGLQIEFHAPDREGKKLLLEHYLKLYDIDEIDLDTLSYFFDTNDTAADIEEACVEAWREAIYRKIEEGNENPYLSQKDLMAVFLKRLVGPPPSFVNLSPEARFNIAIHECGHAIMAIAYGIPLRLITIQPGKEGLGRTMTFEAQEHIDTMEAWVSHIRVGLGGIAAEKVYDLPPLVGATRDIEEVNRLATRLVDQLYAGKEARLLNVSAIANERVDCHANNVTPSISLAAIDKADSDIDNILKLANQDAEQTLANVGREYLSEIANTLNERITLTGEEFKGEFAKIIGGNDFHRFRSNIDFTNHLSLVL